MIKVEDPRFRNLERKIGLFILVALTGIILVVALVGVQRGVFTKTYTLHFTVDRGTGFSKGMPVKLSGFRIGRVTDLALNEQAMVAITIEVDHKYKKWIRSDSTVKLVKEGLVGDSIVEVAVGSLNKPEIRDGESISYVKTKGLDEMADEIAEKVKPVLHEVREIIAYVNDPNSDLKKTIHNLEILTRNLEQTRGRADLLLASTTRNLETISQRSTSLLETTTRKIDSLDVAKLNTSLEKLPPLLEKTDTAMATVNAISAETKKLAEQAFPQIPGLLSRTDELLFNTDRLMNNLNNSWLLGGGAASSPHRSISAGDSHD
ncbi:MAG: MlaD family protein [Trichlorobacter sp.]|jgi:phospholipid/cholesterol/gamma-HCH transport system substrate-binding protein